MRKLLRNRVFGATALALTMLVAACGGSGGDADGTPINVASFNFPESTILAEIYAQVLEANDYPVERQLNIGSREIIFPLLEDGTVGLLPEYVGSSLAVGFGVEGQFGTDAGAAELSTQFESLAVTVLDPAPAEDKNAFVVSQAFADSNGVRSVSDLSGLDSVTFAGPPECENRPTCLVGLQDTYGLTNVTFESIAEGSARIAALENGEVDMVLLFSTQPVIVEKGFVALEDDQGIVGAENIVPVVLTSLVDEYGSDFSNLLNRVSARITTEVLLDLNGRVELEAEDPADVAAAWLEENGFTG